MVPLIIKCDPNQPPSHVNSYLFTGFHNLCLPKFFVSFYNLHVFFVILFYRLASLMPGHIGFPSSSVKIKWMPDFWNFFLVNVMVSEVCAFFGDLLPRLMKDSSHVLPSARQLTLLDQVFTGLFFDIATTKKFLILALVIVYCFCLFSCLSCLVVLLRTGLTDPCGMPLILKNFSLK